MAEPTPTNRDAEDLRTRIAQAASRAATSHGERLYHVRFAIADEVLAELGDYRQQVIGEIAAALAAPGQCDCRQREANRHLPVGERTHEGGCSWWPDEHAARAVRRLAGAVPVTPPSAPETDQEAALAAAAEKANRDPTTIRAVQRWMALDLHQALGSDPQHFDERMAGGWADTWAELLTEVRELVAGVCGHDLEAFDAQAVTLSRVVALRAELRHWCPNRVTTAAVVELLDSALGDTPGPAGMDPVEFAAMQRLAGDAAAAGVQLAEARAERDALIEAGRDLARRYGRILDDTRAGLARQLVRAEVERARLRPVVQAAKVYAGVLRLAEQVKPGGVSAPARALLAALDALTPGDVRKSAQAQPGAEIRTPDSNSDPEKPNEPGATSTDVPDSSTDDHQTSTDRDEGAPICKPCREGWHVNCGQDEATPADRCTCPYPGAPPAVPGIDGAEAS